MEVPPAPGCTSMKTDKKTESAPLICARCAEELETGKGIFYRVFIEAVADPAPPHDPDEKQALDLREQMRKLLDQLENMSEQEAMDQVYRRLTLYLCGPCFQHWIEDPTG